MDAVPKEIQGPAGVVHIPTQEARWIDGVTGHAQKVVSSHTTEQAIPSATQPVPRSKELDQVGAERVGAEPIIDINDFKDFMGKTAGHVVKSVGGEEELLTHAETASGPKVISFVKERRRRMEQAA